MTRTISELTNRIVKGVPKKTAHGNWKILTDTIPVGKKIAGWSTCEVQVFNFLFSNRENLGIREVIKFRNLLVDGQIVLSDGTRLVVEVKMRMNWMKACQSEYQF